MNARAIMDARTVFEKSRVDIPREITIENVCKVVTALRLAPISELAAHFYDGFGDTTMVIDGRPSLIAYLRINHQLAVIIKALLDSGDLILKSCSPMLYHISGIWPLLPLATSIDNEYDNLHWLPVCLCPNLEKRACEEKGGM